MTKTILILFFIATSIALAYIAVRNGQPLTCDDYFYEEDAIVCIVRLERY